MYKGRILVVEDEMVTAADLKTDLMARGYEVPAIVASAQEAVQATDQIFPDLVLMDITLSGSKSGIDAAEEIRRKHTIPILFLSAHIDAPTVARAKKTEPFGYITKPWNIETLMSSIEVALYKGAADAARRRAEEELRRVQEQQRVILHNIAVCVMFVRARKIVWANPAVATVFGYSPDEVLGKETEIFYDDPTGYARIGNAGYQALARGETYTDEVPMRRKDGSSLWCHLIGQSIDRQNQERGSIWLLEDVSARRSLERERERLIAELHEALAHVKQLSGFLPICAWCKKIRNDQGYWQQIEEYITDHSDAAFSHGICQDCKTKLSPES